MSGTAPIFSHAASTRHWVKQCAKGRCSDGSPTRPLMMKARSALPRLTTVVGAGPPCCAAFVSLASALIFSTRSRSLLVWKRCWQSAYSSPISCIAAVVFCRPGKMKRPRSAADMRMA